MAEIELTAEQQAAIGTIEKLLRLAARNSNPEEAASAMAKAQEWMDRYSLSAADVSSDEDKSAVREQLKQRGGMYAYQRDLWKALAKLNFCLHFVITHEVFRKRGRGSLGTDYWGKEFHHTIVGRLVNTRTTRVMGEYLEATIERLVKERYPANTQRFSREATAYREGIADQVVLRLHERRRSAEAEEARRRAEAARAATGTSQALTLADLSKAEHDANMDVVMGEGWSARRASQRADDARRRKEAEEAYTAWAAANPKEAAKEAARARKEAERAGRRSSGRAYRERAPDAREKRSWSSQYAQGYDKGREVGLDVQTGDRATTHKRIEK